MATGDTGAALPGASSDKPPTIPITEASAKAQATQELKQGGIPGIGKPGVGKGPTEASGKGFPEAVGEGPSTGKVAPIPITEPDAKDAAAREAEQGGTAIKPLERKTSGSGKGECTMRLTLDWVVDPHNTRLLACRHP